MTKQPTRERERLQWQKKQDLCRIHGLIQGLLIGLNLFGEEANQQGLKNALVEVKNILEKYV